MQKIYILLSFYLFNGTVYSFGQPGSPDPGFGNNGQVVTSFFADEHAFANNVFVQQDGQILVSGSTNVPSSHSIGVLLRFREDGSPDPAFNGNGKLYIILPDIDVAASASVQQEDGKIVTLIHLNGAKDSIALMRINEDGTTDNYFGKNGISFLHLGMDYQGAKGLALQEDGKIIIGHYAGNQGELFDLFYLARFNPDGSRDNSFGNKGVVTTKVGESWTGIGSILIQPDGKIVVGGHAVFNGYESFVTVRYHSNGTLDQGFGQDGIAHTTVDSVNASAYGAILQPDGKIVLAGYYDEGTGNSDFLAIRYLPNGQLDHTFHGDGLARIAVSNLADAARSILLQPDGKIVLGGYAHSNQLNGGSNMALVRLMENGLPDFTFDNDGVVNYPLIPDNSDAIYSMDVTADGSIIVTGLARVEYQNRIGVVKFMTGLTVGNDEVNTLTKNIIVYPNPVCDRITLEYTLDEGEEMAVYLMDLSGRYLQVLLPEAYYYQGMNLNNIDIPSSLSSGQYLIGIKSGKKITSVPVVIR